MQIDTQRGRTLEKEVCCCAPLGYHRTNIIKKLKEVKDDIQSTSAICMNPSPNMSKASQDTSLCFDDYTASARPGPALI